MLLDTRPTPFDLRFRALGFPVRVHPLFWLGMALLGSDQLRLGLDLGLIWVACGFASILVHELGHAVVIRRYGSPASIELVAFGGLAVPAYPSSSPVRRLFIALAGPAAGALFLGLVWGSNELFAWGVPPPDDGRRKNLYPAVLYIDLVFMNLVWTLLNLLPIWPFDGGRALRELLALARHRRPDRTALWVSVCTAGLLGGYGLAVNFGGGPRAWGESVPWWLWWALPGPTGTIFFLLLAVQSYLLVNQTARGPRAYRDDDDRLPWERR